MRKIIASAVILWLGYNAVGQEFNRYVVEILQSYPTDGTHRYYWPREGAWIGNTRDLYYRGELFAQGDPEGRCYCCGLTFEVFFRAWERHCELAGRPFIIGNFSSPELVQFREQWFGADGNPKTHYDALIVSGLGKAVELEDARPGDFVQFWRHTGSGHSVIFMDWLRDNSMNITGIEYWSTQKSTDGVGYNTELIGENSGIDIARIYIARAGLVR